MFARKTLFAGLFAAVLTSASLSAAFASVAISVDKTTQHMTVSVDGSTRYAWPVSTGRPGYDTPDGTFHPSWMSAMHYSKEYENAPMPDSIFFTKGDAIHGFTDTPFGVTAVSHGCVRLPRQDAAVLFQIVKQEGMANTTIDVHGHIPQRPLIAQRQAPLREAEGEQQMPAPSGYGDGYGAPRAYGRWANDDYGPSPFALRAAPFDDDGGFAGYGGYDGPRRRASYGSNYERSYAPYGD